MRAAPSYDDRAERERTVEVTPHCVVCGGRVIRAGYIRGDAFHCLTEDVLVSTSDVVYEER